MPHKTFFFDALIAFLRSPFIARAGSAISFYSPHEAFEFSSERDPFMLYFEFVRTSSIAPNKLSFFISSFWIRSESQLHSLENWFCCLPQPFAYMSSYRNFYGHRVSDNVWLKDSIRADIFKTETGKRQKKLSSCCDLASKCNICAHLKSIFSLIFSKKNRFVFQKGALLLWLGTQIHLSAHLKSIFSICYPPNKIRKNEQKVVSLFWLGARDSWSKVKRYEPDAPIA